MKVKARKAQAMIEYVITFSILALVVGSLVYLLRATKSAVVRTERHVSSEYP